MRLQQRCPLAPWPRCESGQDRVDEKFGLVPSSRHFVYLDHDAKTRARDRRSRSLPKTDTRATFLALHGAE
jgi:hypothetical protein